ncbi:HlyD family efflux transporter periplasmic adaptor subunit [Aeoliella sp. ICT_H6.2]|uniref:HlyD family efflux transporter periplasmic adaptor subunit n=1 Tax=Aeoliella straminimaris TaxID=2954799 RepID=A0A9X2JHW8_9BACT|nr:HlyD family efflux transporter periplasmic adaptor subunit [Aeoliella straminimaris]MCO6046480.1 HlyD family efflux transporter periplasmic adaptor subunit [Aeoliella straminimaris]
MKTTALALLIGLSASTLLAQSADSGNPVIEDCQLSLLPENEIEISAIKAGMLEQLNVHEGSIAEEGEVIAKLDDIEARMQLRVAQQKQQAAADRATDKVEEEYAEAAADAAEADLIDFRAANNAGVEGVVAPTELRAKELELTRAKLQIKKAFKDRQLAISDWRVAKVETEAADLEITRRRVTAPFSGQVVELFRKQGEWVDPGEPILKFVRYDVLQCDGYVNLEKYDPREVDGCEVTIEVHVGHGRLEQAKGRITYVEQQARNEGYFTYRVVAKVPNHVDRGRWALYPGLKATMTIHLGTANQAMTSRIEGLPSVERRAMNEGR